MWDDLFKPIPPWWRPILRRRWHRETARLVEWYESLRPAPRSKDTD